MVDSSSTDLGGHIVVIEEPIGKRRGFGRMEGMVKERKGG